MKDFPFSHKIDVSTQDEDPIDASPYCPVYNQCICALHRWRKGNA